MGQQLLRIQRHRLWLLQQLGHQRQQAIPHSAVHHPSHSHALCSLIHPSLTTAPQPCSLQSYIPVIDDCPTAPLPQSSSLHDYAAFGFSGFHWLHMGPHEQGLPPASRRTPSDTPVIDNCPTAPLPQPCSLHFHTSIIDHCPTAPLSQPCFLQSYTSIIDKCPTAPMVQGEGVSSKQCWVCQAAGLHASREMREGDPKGMSMPSHGPCSLQSHTSTIDNCPTAPLSQPSLQSHTSIIDNCPTALATKSFQQHQAARHFTGHHYHQQISPLPSHASSVVASSLRFTRPWSLQSITFCLLHSH